MSQDNNTGQDREHSVNSQGGLSQQDLLFFDNLLSGSVSLQSDTSKNNRSYSSDLLSLADDDRDDYSGSTMVPSTVQPIQQKKNLSTGYSLQPKVELEDDIDFGQFVSSTSELSPKNGFLSNQPPLLSIPQPSKPAYSSSTKQGIDLQARELPPPSSMKQEISPELSSQRSKLDMRSSRTLSPPSSNAGQRSNININMNQPLRFGQHLQHGQLVGSGLNFLDNRTPKSLHAAPSSRLSNNSSASLSTFAPRNAKSQTASKNLLETAEDLQQWPEETVDSPQAISPAVLKPEALLPLFKSNFFPLPATLFQDLAPLPYPLKRRVLSHAKTKAFFDNMLSGVHIALRICAGRRRRGGHYEADREARETSRLWKDLAHRLSGVGLTNLPNIDSAYLLPKFLGDPRELCIVCGVGAFEKVKGATIESKWNNLKRGHGSCTNWWEHEQALLEG